MTGRTALRGRVLVARLDSMGDVLLTGGAVRAVAAAVRAGGSGGVGSGGVGAGGAGSGGERSVTMLVGPGHAAAARLLPGVDDVLQFEAPWVVFDPPAVDPVATTALLDRLRSRRFDAALIFGSFHQSPLPLALLLRMAGVGWIGAISEDYPGSLLDLRHRTDDDLPEAERNLSLAVAAGGAPDRAGAGLAVRRPLPDPMPWTGAEPYVVFHPGATTESRRPTREHARELVRGLTEAGRRVLVTGSPGEAELTRYVAAEQAVDLGGRLDLPALAAVLDRADCVVAPNTGPAHLAAAVGTPVVSLFAPVVPAARWAPYGVPVVLLGDQGADCRGTRARNCPVAGHPCLSSISAAALTAAVDRLVPASASAPRPVPERSAMTLTEPSSTPPEVREPDSLVEHFAALAAAAGRLEAAGPRLRQWAGQLVELYGRGGRLLACGNGGSAAEAQHLTGELVGRFRHDRQPLSAIALHAETSAATAILNDYGPEELYARQVRAHGRPGDVLVAFSTSGTSGNVLAAAKAAHEVGVQVWALTGPGPNPLEALSDDALTVEAPTVATVQEIHLSLVHALCVALDEALGVGR